jgi:hypothetical protein
MTCLVALLFTAGATPQPPAAPLAPAPAVATFDGSWTVVYAENVGRPVTLGPTLPIQNGTVTINLGHPVTYRLDIGPGHAVQAVPAGTVAPGTSRPAAPAATPAPPGTVTAPGAGGVGSGEITSPARGAQSGRSPAPPESPGAATGPGSSPLPAAPPAGRTAPEPGTLQGTFILSQEYLVLSLNPVGAAALGASPGTTTGTDVGPGAAPGGARTTPPTAAPGPNAAGGGVRQDAFVLILRRTVPAR